VEVAPGSAVVQVKRDDGQTSNSVSVGVADRAPRLIAAVNQDYSVNSRVGQDPDTTHPAHIGDVLTIYAIGLGATNPSVASGQPAPSAEPLARVSSDLSVNFSGSVVGPFASPAYAGLTPTSAGLYQINVVVPDGTPKGIIDLSVGFIGSRSNSLRVAIQ